MLDKCIFYETGNMILKILNAVKTQKMKIIHCFAAWNKIVQPKLNKHEQNWQL